MCLGIPGRVVEIGSENGLRMGKVDFGGVLKQVCLEHTPEALPGTYVIVHVGFALQVIDEQEARQVFEFLAAIDELEEIKAGCSDAAQAPQSQSSQSHALRSQVSRSQVSRSQVPR